MENKINLQPYSSLLKPKNKLPQPDYKAQLIAISLLLHCWGSLNIEVTTPVFQFKSKPAQTSVIEIVKKLIDHQ